MSLFKTRDWWSTQCGDGEDFDEACVAIGNADDAADGASKIVVGSHAGILRVFAPSRREYAVEHLLLEHDLGLPIIGVEVGAFSSSRDGRTSVAVLHPRKLAVYALDDGGGAPEAYHTLALEYEHRLEHTAANMCAGRFGGSRLEQLCVQSMDGQLKIFEQETLAFARYLPGFLLPGPLAYDPRLDAFITCSSTFELECYSHAALAAAAAEKPPPAGTSRQGSSSSSSSSDASKRVKPDWSLCLGEAALSITIAEGFADAGNHVGDLGGDSRASAGPSSSSSGGAFPSPEIVVVAERNVFVVSRTGDVTMQKKVDYAPTTCFAFGTGARGAGALDRVVVGDASGAAMVYAGARTLWAAKFDRPTPPVYLSVGSFAGVDGLLCSLTETGALALSYLGAEPPRTVARPYEGKEPRYDEMDDELRRLTATIREFEDPGEGGGGGVASAGRAAAPARAEPADRVGVRVQMPTTVDRRGAHAGSNADTPVKRVTMRVFVSYSGAGTLRGATLAVDAPAPMEVLFAADASGGGGGEPFGAGERRRSATFVVPAIVGGGEPAQVPITLAASASGGCGVPTSNAVTVTVTYAGESGGESGGGDRGGGGVGNRIARREVEAPMALFCDVVSPIKAAAYKVTLDTNRPPPRLADLFEDVIAASSGGGGGDGSGSGGFSFSLEEAANALGAGGNVVSFAYADGSDATVVVSKNAGRYRLQSSRFEALWLLTRELTRRLRAYYAEDPGASDPGEDEPFAISFGEALPLQDFFAVVDAHHAARVARQTASRALANAAHQFRAVQKRLLMKFKDKTPARLAHLDALLDQTRRLVSRRADAFDDAESALAAAAATLSAATRTVAGLIALRFGLGDDAARVLEAYVSPVVNDQMDHGWEEWTDASVTSLLKTRLAKNAARDGDDGAERERAPGGGARRPAPMTDTSKLKKHISVVCERLARGGTLA